MFEYTVLKIVEPEGLADILWEYVRKHEESRDMRR